VGTPVLHYPPLLALGLKPHHIGVAQHGNGHGLLCVQVVQGDDRPPGLGPAEALRLIRSWLSLLLPLLLLLCKCPVRRWRSSCATIEQAAGMTQKIQVSLCWK
jgi:hypothetical protein